MGIDLNDQRKMHTVVLRFRFMNNQVFSAYRHPCLVHSRVNTLTRELSVGVPQTIQLSMEMEEC
ncbi:hypothetical protein GCM10025859_24680 [Alicyclobacillus fastidiosus]|nr:hypothetical protein GCM10025859_24680 [Alicyclobacillus fastidiosus]